MFMSGEEIEALKEPEYWNDRYGKADGQEPTHEWFRTYSDLEPFFHKHFFAKHNPVQSPKILHLGAGDSTIPQDLLKRGYQDQICIDFSAVIVERMSAQKTEGLHWICGDVRDMPAIETASIDVACDKGTLDAMIHGSPWNPPDDVKENSGRYMREVARTLKDSGVFLYITYRQPHFIKPLLNQDELWNMHMETLGAGNSFEYYAFVLHKAPSASRDARTGHCLQPAKSPCGTTNNTKI